MRPPETAFYLLSDVIVLFLASCPEEAINLCVVLLRTIQTVLGLLYHLASIRRVRLFPALSHTSPPTQCPILSARESVEINSLVVRIPSTNLSNC